MNYDKPYAKYSYTGPVLHFDTCVMSKWSAETYAPTENKARSNLAYRFKNEFGYASNARIILPGKLIKIGGR